MDVMSFDDLSAAVRAAEELRLNGNVEAARAIYTAAAVSRIASVRGSAAALTHHDLLILEQLAALAAASGDAACAIDVLRIVANAADAHGDAGRGDLARLKLVHLLISDARFYDVRVVLDELADRIGSVESLKVSAEGLRDFESSLRWPAADADRLLPWLYLELGRFIAAFGMPATALALARRGRAAAALAAAADTRQMTAPLDLLMASSHLELGDATAATALLADLIIDARVHPAWALQSLELRGRCAFLRGDLRRAIDDFSAAANVAAQSGLVRAAAVARVNLAELRIALNQTAGAEQLLREVNSLIERGADSILDARIASLRARIERGSGIRESSLQPAVVLQQAEMPSNDVPSAVAGTRSARETDFLGWFDRRAARLRTSLHGPDARRLLAEIQQDFGASESLLVRARIEVLEAMVLLAEQCGQRACETNQRLEELLVRSIEFFSRMELDYESYEAHRLLVVHLRSSGVGSARIDPLVTRAQELLAGLSDGLTPTERAQFLLDKWSQDEETLALAINDAVYRLQRTRLRIQRWMFTLRETHRLLDRAFDVRTSLANATTGAKTAPSAVPLLRRIALVPRDRVTLVFLVLPENVVVFRLGWFDAQFVVAKITRIEVRALVRRWHEAVTALSDEDPSEIAKTLMARLELGPLLNLPPRVRALTICADDALHGFPFAALRVGGRYLVERFAVSVAHEPFARSGPPADGRGVCAIAVDEAMAGFIALPGTKEQLAHLQSFAARNGITVDLLHNEQLDVQCVLERMKRARVLHVSCHGVFSPDRPQETGLVMMNAGGEPRILTLNEVAATDLSLVEHATLAACWGADNYVLPGRWIVSLPEVMRRAGVRSVLASLWEVDDTRVTAFLRRFYDQSATLARDEALRAVQLDCLRDPDGRDVLWWAGFQLYGETRRMAW